MTISKANTSINDLLAISSIESQRCSERLVEYGLSVLEGFTVDEKRVVEDSIREVMLSSIASIAGNPAITENCSTCSFRYKGLFKEFLNCSKGVSINNRGVPTTYKCQFYRGDLNDN